MGLLVVGPDGMSNSNILEVMRARNVKYLIIIFFCSFLTHSCTDLDVINEIEPDEARAFSNQEQLMELAGNSFRTFHNEIREYGNSLARPLGVMADYLTSSWGLLKLYSLEPRTQMEFYPNDVDYGYRHQLVGHWEGSYQAVYYANMVLDVLDKDNSMGLSVDQLALLESFCLFVSGVSHGYLGLICDQAMVIKPGVDNSNLQLQPWMEVVDASLEMLNKAIEISDGNTFQVPPDWVGGQAMSNVDLSQLANGYAARILAYSSRTSTQNSDIDWDRVLEYAQKGITWDFSPELGDTYGWYDFYTCYGRYPGYARVDMRIINLLDHDYPSRWPRDNISWNTPDGLDPGEADPDDERLLTDFEYLAGNNFRPDRGYYNFSHYRHSRYDYVFEEVWYGNKPKPSFLAWEVKLLEAEAWLRLENSEAALAILNDPAGPRKSRGGVPDLLPTNDILRYILDEKEIECFLTGVGVSFFDMRRNDRLQPGTWLHFPVPATELELLSLPLYNIYTRPDGIDGSAGGWTGWDE